MNVLCVAFPAVAVALMASTQPAPARPEFAVASIKPNNRPCGTTYGVGGGAGGGKCVTLKELIRLAWRVQPFQISGGPSWIATEHFDVAGKAEDLNANPDELRLMLRSLLEDRFHLRLHATSKTSVVYALVPAKGGPKLRLSADQTSPDVNGPAPNGAGPNHGAIRMGSGLMLGNAVPLSRFATFLSQRVDRLVIDRTNLSGRFDIQLQWAPGSGDIAGDFAPSIIGASGETLTADPSGPSLFTAIQEQLGLRLESARAPVDLFVIDHVERPTPN